MQTWDLELNWFFLFPSKRLFAICEQHVQADMSTVLASTFFLLFCFAEWRGRTMMCGNKLQDNAYMVKNSICDHWIGICKSIYPLEMEFSNSYQKALKFHPPQLPKLKKSKHQTTEISSVPKIQEMATEAKGNQLHGLKCS